MNMGTPTDPLEAALPKLFKDKIARHRATHLTRTDNTYSKYASGHKILKNSALALVVSNSGLLHGLSRLSHFQWTTESLDRASPESDSELSARSVPALKSAGSSCSSDLNSCPNTLR